MAGARVLLDTNILVSGMVFTKGNEHEILRLIEQGKLRVVIPETVLMEAKKVFAAKFAGTDKLLDLFLERIRPEIIRLREVLPLLEIHASKVKDTKDAPIYSAIILGKPDFAVTGDKLLRLDLRRWAELASNTNVCSSRELLQQLGRKIR